MSDVVEAKKFEVPVVTETPTQQEPPRNAALSSQVEFNLHSCYYRDFFLLRTPITINGRPAVIKVVNGDPVLPVVSQPGGSSISIKLSTIMEQAIRPVLRNHGVYHVKMFYHEEVALYSIKFRSKSSLKRFLTDKEAVQKKLASAIISVHDLESKQQSSSQSPSMLQLSVNMKVYLVCPPQSNGPPDVHEVTLANYPSMTWMWQKSELFKFDVNMFTQNTCAAALKGGAPGQALETAELSDLDLELKSVNMWFKLGVQLKIPTEDLLAIRVKHMTIDECRLEMLIRWGQREKPTWSKLVEALVNIDRNVLAHQLAEKYGIPRQLRPQAIKSGPSVSSEISKSEKLLSMKHGELEKARESESDIRKQIENKLENEVPSLQREVQLLISENKLLEKQLQHRNDELEMFKQVRAEQDKLKKELQLLVDKKDREIKFLQDELKLKELELVNTKKKLKEKENELTRMMEELSAKSDQVLKLEKEVEKLRQSFAKQQEELNKKMIEATAKSVSHEAYLKEKQIQQDFAKTEADRIKQETELFNRMQKQKEKNISALSEKIAEQEKEIEKLQKALDSCQPSAENVNEDEERVHQLLISTIQLKLRKAEEEKMLHILGKHEREMELENQERDTESVSLSPAVKRHKPLPVHTPLSEPKLSLNFKWKQGSNLPFEMSWVPSVVVMKGKIFVGGGFAKVEEMQTVLVYNPPDNTWNQQYVPQNEYFFFTMTVLNETQLVSIGGIHPTTGKVTNKLAVWENGQHRWTEQLPQMMTSCCCPSVNTYKQWLLVAGGRGEQGHYLSRVEILNISTRQWYQVASLPKAGTKMSSTVIGITWYLMGGGDKDKGWSKSVMSVCIEDLISQAISQPAGANSSTSSPWNTLPDTPLVGSTALAFQGELLSIGGGSLSYPNYSSSIYLYQSSTREWVKAGDMPTERGMCGCAVLPSGHIIVAGGYGAAADRVDIAQVMTL